MWTCSSCKRAFQKFNQTHYCGNTSIEVLLSGKNEFTLSLFDSIMAKFNEIGPVNLYATKSMIVIANDMRFAYITTVGKNFIDLVLPFRQPFIDNMCFRKIALVPGSNDYNHHLRLMQIDDLNEEVISYFRKAYENGKAI